MNDDKRGGIGEGIRTGMGILAAVKDAITETFDEAVSRGDLSPDRARSAMQEAAQRVQLSLDEARDRLDVVPRRDFEMLRSEVLELRRRLELLEGAPASPTPEGTSSDSIVVD